MYVGTYDIMKNEKHSVIALCGIFEPSYELCMFRGNTEKRSNASRLMTGTNIPFGDFERSALLNS